MEKREKVDLRELSKNTKIPVKILQNMIKDGAFSEYMDDADQEFLTRLLGIIGKNYFIRHCILRIRSNDRVRFIAQAHLETKWERYIYTNMVNNFTQGNKLTIETFVKKAEKVFQFQMTEEDIQRVKNIRDSIYKKRSRMKKNQ
ncbi:MAG: hypothetical protein ACD_74C00155G0011 [uncultured bacterium]|nr:MAG: hypothetical protein ACD_74C00155G0011 [uncultured bacterium]